MANCSPFEDYQVGQVLTLNVIPGRGKISASTICARIRRLHKPCTLSCCMIVDLLGKDCSETQVFLKLYDRRFSEQFRNDYGGSPWTKDVEKEYINIIGTDEERQFLHNLEAIPNYEDDTGEDWNDGQIELHLTKEAHKMFDAETTVYDALHNIQGKLVPHLLAPVQLTLSHPDADVDATYATAKLPPIKGILLQYIDSFCLSDLQNHAPRSEWQDIVDQAVAIVGEMGDYGVFNRDGRPDKFLVQRESNGSYRAVMIDFGLARLRGQNESILDWNKTKLEFGEERAVGDVMRMRLQKEGFDLRFEESAKYVALSEWYEANKEPE